MKKSAILFIVIISLLIGAFSNKPHSLIEITEAITMYFEKRPMEKIFLHLDKPYYSVGDDIWFSAYVLDYQGGKPSRLSEILHVELFDRFGQPILQQKIQIKNGLANGLMVLPDTLKANYYALKAYTNWSRNFGDGLLFNHALKIVSPSPEQFISVKSDVQFYPEGGRLLSGKLNHVAFRTNKLSKSQAFLINNEKDTINTFEYDGNGFGLIKLIPESIEMSYQLKFEDETTFYTIPGSSTSGTNLRMQERDDVFNLIIEGSLEYAANELSIIILNNGNIISAFSKKLDPAGLFLIFKKDDLPYGLNHLLVYSEQDEFLNDRHFYNADPSKEFPLEIKLQSSYHVRDQIYMEVKSNTQTTSAISISVTPVDYFGDAKKPIITDASHNGMLTSKQFSLNQQLIAEQIEVYNPEIISEGKVPIFPFEIQRKDFFQVDILIENEDLIENDKFALTLREGDYINLYFTEPKQPDRLSIIIPSFSGNRDLTIAPHGIQSKDLDISIQTSAGNKSLNNLFIQNDQETAYANHIWENKVTRRMFDIEYKTTDGFSNTSSLVFNTLGSFDERVFLREYIQLPSMKEVFKELLPYARMKELENGEIKIQLNDNSGLVKYNPLMENEPFRMIDGVPVYDSKIIANLDPSTVKSIELLYRKTTLDNTEMHGVLHILTNEGNFGEIHDVGQGSCSFQGYSQNFQFAIPTIDSKTPDFRSTLYWNPNLTIDNSDYSTISFPASDEPGEYKVEIQGVTADGRPIFHESFLTILPTQ